MPSRVGRLLREYQRGYRPCELGLGVFHSGCGPLRARACVRVHASARACRVGAAGTGQARVGRKTRETRWQGGGGAGSWSRFRQTKVFGKRSVLVGLGEGKKRLRHPKPRLKPP